MIKTMSNRDIYSIGIKLSEFFSSDMVKERYLPAKINFLIQKNKLELFKVCDQLEKVRIDVVNKYNPIQELSEMELNSVNNELDELLDLTQKINITMIKISDLDGLDFTLDQMDALMFMIED